MLADFFLDLIFPVRCVGCEKIDRQGSPLCAECKRKIPLQQNLFCGICRARLPERKKICHLASPFILGAASNYENDSVRELISLIKFKFYKPAAEILSDILASYFRIVVLNVPSSALIVPVPLHAKRLRERGFNQAELIAQGLGERLGIPCSTNLLSRIKPTYRQSDLKSVEDRRRNVREAFQASSIEPHIKQIILVDDVVTSGATLTAAAEAMKTAGAKRILALTAAKA